MKLLISFFALLSQVAILAKPFKECLDSDGAKCQGGLVESGVYATIPKGSWQNAYDETMKLNVFLPGKPNNGQYPIVVFFTGFQSVQPSSTYQDVLGEMAAKGEGSIVVAWDGLGHSNCLRPNASIHNFLPYFQYIEDGHLQTFINSKFTRPASYDIKKLVIAGHSAGNRLSILLSLLKPSVGLILLDPVDQGPFNISPSIFNSTPVAYAGPIMILTTELGTRKGTAMFPPCVNPGDGLKFYNAFQGNTKYRFDALYYGHGDFLSPDSLISWGVGFTHMCPTVSDPKVHTFQGLRDFVSGTSAAFVSLYGRKHASFEKYLTDASLFNVGANLTTDNVKDHHFWNF